jgi:hypothetical protein
LVRSWCLPDQEQQLTTREGDAAEPTREEFPVYTVDELGREFRQSEIITHVAQYQ